MKDEKKKHKYGSLFVLWGFSMGSVLSPNYWTSPLDAEAAVPTYSQTVVFTERDYNSGSQQITIPNNARNIQATTDNGTVSTSKSGSTLTVNVNGGSYHRTGSYYNNYAKAYYASSYQTSSTTSFPSTLNYSSGEYTGTLSKVNSPYVSSGSYTPAQSTTATGYRDTGLYGSPGSLPYSISYDSGGYSGTLYRDGSAYVSGGSYVADEYRTEYAQRSTSAGGSPSSLPDSVSYNSGGYSGTLSKSGSATVTSGALVADATKTVTQTESRSTNSFPSTVSYSSGGYSGTLSKYGSVEQILVSGSITPAHTKTVTEPEFMKKRVDWHEWDGKNWLYDHTVDDPSKEPQTKSYNSGGYVGTLDREGTRIVKTYLADYPNKPRKGDKFATLWYDRYYQFSGQVTKPASDNRVFRYEQDYRGMVTDPGYDNRVWTQNYSGTVVNPGYDSRSYAQKYSGTVTKPAVDTRMYRQDYEGWTYAPGYSTNYWYKYNVTVTYEADVIAPNLNLSYDKNAGVIRATASDNEYGLNYIQLPSGSVVYSTTASYAVSNGGTYSFTAVDNGGNTTTKSITLQAPPITTSQEIPNSTWTNANSYWFKINTSSVYDTAPLVTLEKNGVKVQEEVTDEMTYNLTDNGTYRIKVKDGSIVSTKDVTVTNFDRTNPNLSITFDGSTPSDGLDVGTTATDTQSGVKSITLPSGTVVNGGNSVYKTSVQGSFNFIVEDVAGNKRTVSTTVDKPTLSVTKAINAPTNVASYNLIASFIPKYVTTGQIKNLNTNATTTTNTLNTPVSSNGTYKFQANDGGILSDIEEESVGNFDRTAPNGVIFLDSSTPSDGLDIQVDATDDASGVKSITLPNNQVVNDDKAVYKTTTSGTFSFVIEDVAGNKKTVSTTINKPVLTVTKEITAPTNAASMKLNASFTPQYVSKGIITKDGVDAQGNQLESVVTENGTYRFRANDGGVLSDYVDVVVGNFDRTVPAGVLSYDGSSPSDGLDVNVVASDDNAGIKTITLPNNSVVTGTTANFKTSAPGSFDFILEDKAGNKRTVTVVVEKPNLTVTQTVTGQTNASSYNLNASFTPRYVATGQIKNLSTGGTSTTNNLSYTVSANGTYKFQANDGGILSDIETVEVKNFDRTAPSGTINYDGSTPNDGLNIIVNGSDTESPIKSITQPDGVVKVTSMVNYTVNSPGNYNFTIEDSAGNKRTVTATIVKPTVSVVNTVTTPTNASEYQLSISYSAPKYSNSMEIESTFQSEIRRSYNPSYLAKENGDYRFRVNDGGILSDYIDTSVTNFDRVKPDVTIVEKSKTTASTTVNVKVLDKGDLK